MPLLKRMLRHSKCFKIVLLLLCFSPLCLAKDIAITFDDAPRKAEGYFDGPTRANTLIAALKRHKVEQVFFLLTVKGLIKKEYIDCRLIVKQVILLLIIHTATLTLIRSV
ncbi:polysaccharide deacetylase family protein [Shewanella surugensis]|uniref:NodB homology domain-containing protein n=1 Tax=Shewanella surugensis TaxID=212020 RepID=A0ABT0LJ62_9GAMM|nr:polysaccharide deacetylase family protein [Shewanella surugensis]MCL1127747.1 hypothetical protein [Shewanella surugensis]